MPQPLIYLATEEAAKLKPLKPLKGNRVAAQRYVDRVTRSGYWRRGCPGYFTESDPAPTRVWVFETDDPTEGAYTTRYKTAEKDGKELPAMFVGRGDVNGVEAIADRWVLLHELAHIMTIHVQGEGHHGQKFAESFHGLIKEFLGIEHANNLIERCKINKIRLRYGLLI